MNIIKISYPKMYTYHDALVFIQTSPDLIYEFVKKLPPFKVKIGNSCYDYLENNQYIDIDYDFSESIMTNNIKNAIISRIREDKFKIIESL